MKKIVKILLTVFLGGLLILPLVMWPWAPVPYEIPRVWFIQRWIEIIGICGIVISPIILKKKKIDTKLFLFLIIFAAIASLASFEGKDVLKSLWGNYYRNDGLVTLFHLVGLSLFVMLYWRRSWEYKTVGAIGIGVFTTSIWTLIVAFRLYILGDKSLDIWNNGTIGASFGNPNFLAGFLVVTMPFIFYMITQRQDKIIRLFWVTALIIEIIAILTTGSWGGIFGILISIIGYLFIQQSKIRWLGIIVMISLLSFLSYLYINHNRNIGFVAEGRDRIFHRIILGISKRPILGFGWANADYAFQAVSWPIAFGNDIYVDKAHSQLLEVLATTGVMGLFIYIGLILRIGMLLICKIGKDKNYIFPKTLLLVLILYIFHSQTNVISIGEEIFFWLIAGIAGGEGV